LLSIQLAIHTHADGLSVPLEDKGREPNRYCSVGGNDLKLYSNGRLLYLLAACRSLHDQRNAARNALQRRPLHPHLFPTESDKSGSL